MQISCNSWTRIDFVTEISSFVRQTQTFDKKHGKKQKKTSKILAGIKQMCIFAAINRVSEGEKTPFRGIFLEYSV